MATKKATWRGTVRVHHGKYEVVVKRVATIPYSGWNKWECYYEARGTVNGKPFVAESPYGFATWKLPAKGEWRSLPRSFPYRCAVAKACKAAYEKAAVRWYH